MIDTAFTLAALEIVFRIHLVVALATAMWLYTSTSSVTRSFTNYRKSVIAVLWPIAFFYGYSTFLKFRAYNRQLKDLVETLQRLHVVSRALRNMDDPMHEHLIFNHCADTNQDYTKVLYITVRKEALEANRRDIQLVGEALNLLKARLDNLKNLPTK